MKSGHIQQSITCRESMALGCSWGVRGVLLPLLFLTACQTASLLPSLDIKQFSAQLDIQQIPYESLTITNGKLVVYMQYGVEANRPSEIRYGADVRAIAKTMCNFSGGYGLKVEYTDQISTSIAGRLIQEYCRGALPADQLIDKYQEPTSVSP